MFPFSTCEHVEKGELQELDTQTLRYGHRRRTPALTNLRVCLRFEQKNNSLGIQAPSQKVKKEALLCRCQPVRSSRTEPEVRYDCDLQTFILFLTSLNMVPLVPTGKDCDERMRRRLLAEQLPCLTRVQSVKAVNILESSNDEKDREHLHSDTRSSHAPNYSEIPVYANFLPFHT